MSIFFYLMMTMTGFCCFGLVAVALLGRGSRTSKRVLAILGTSQHQQGLDVRKSAQIQSKLYALTHWLRGVLGMSADSKLVEQFERAGIYSNGQRDFFLIARILGPILAFLVATFISWNRMMLMMALPGFAYLLPDIILKRLIARRRQKIRLGVPDAVDLLVICVDAGLGMDQAMLRVALELGKRHPGLQQEFLRINREQKAGMLRLDAWQAMARRNNLPELDGFVNMLSQTERFGTPIARALSNFGDNIRQKRRQKAEELAAKTTVKIIFPLVLCIFPSLFIVLLGPPGIKVANGLIGLP